MPVLLACSGISPCAQEANPCPLRTLETDSGIGWDAMAAAGDVDADGIVDLVLGDRCDSAKERYSGRVALVSGRDFHTIWDRRGDRSGQFLGGCVFGVGDLDGDGVPDVAATVGQTSGRPRPLEFLSGKTGAPIPVRVPDAFNVARLGDADHDGFGDVLISVPPEKETSSGWGRMLRGCIEARSGLDGHVLSRIEGPRLFQALGDLDGDGADEFVSFSDVVSLRNGSDGKELLDLSVVGFGTGPTIPLAAGSSGDLDGDGIPDLLLLEERSDGGLRGQVVSSREHRTIARIDEQGGTWWLSGSKIACIGDVDGCGRADWALGAPSFETWEEHAEDRGGMLVVSGRTGKRLKLLRGEGAYSYFGKQIAALGDVDGDGIPDVACTEQVWIERLHKSAFVVHVYSGADLR